MHKVTEPSILYLGTPVVLISTRNEDGSTNVAPMSSAWWLGWSCMLGLANSSLSTQNLLREKECVLNMPSVYQAAAVDKLARLTGSNPVPEGKLHRGYRHEKDKLGAGSLTAEPSDLVKPPRVKECPIQMEAVFESVRPFGSFEMKRPFGPESQKASVISAIEVRIVRVHVEETLLVPDKSNHIDPDNWRPLIMSFAQFYGLGDRVRPSRLAEIPEESYRPFAAMSR
jgi:flavin reductase (DIM6/NTAB) family NADH-FMN oxidoreductase RutF